MLKLKKILLTLSLSAGMTMPAVGLEVTPGGVAAAVGDEYASMTTLVLTGVINAADLDFISTKMTSLVTLDLSGVTIAAYNGKPIVANLTDFPAAQLPAYSLSGLKATTLVLPDGITAIGDGALMGSAIKTLTIPSTVTRIGRSAFSNCNGLSAVTIPVNVTEAGSGIFASCAALETVKCGLSEIPSSAFSDCVSLKEIEMLTPVVTVGDDAFRRCGSLVSFSFPPTLTTIGDKAFSHSGLESADLNDCGKLKYVGSQAFGNCDNLQVVVMPDGVTTVGSGAFLDDKALVEVNFPASAKKVEPFTFKGVESLTDGSMLIGERVDTIGEYALTGMREALNVSLPAGLVYIGDNAFEGWLSLESVNAEDIAAVPSLGDDVWAGVAQSHAHLYVPATLKSAFMAAPQWREFKIGLSDVSGVGANIDPESPSTIKVSRDGTTAIVTSTGDPIEEIAVYDTAGRMLLSRRNVKSSSATVEISHLSAQVYIIHVTTASTAASFKLAR